MLRPIVSAIIFGYYAYLIKGQPKFYFDTLLSKPFVQDEISLIQQKYTPLIAEIPANSIVSFITNVADRTARYYKVQYSLSPLIVIEGISNSSKLAIVEGTEDEIKAITEKHQMFIKSRPEKEIWLLSK